MPSARKSLPRAIAAFVIAPLTGPFVEFLYYVVVSHGIHKAVDNARWEKRVWGLFTFDFPAMYWGSFGLLIVSYAVWKVVRGYRYSVRFVACVLLWMAAGVALHVVATPSRMRSWEGALVAATLVSIVMLCTSISFLAIAYGRGRSIVSARNLE